MSGSGCGEFHIPAFTQPLDDRRSPSAESRLTSGPRSRLVLRDDWHHNGAFLLAHAFGWFSGAGWTFSKPSTVAPGKPVVRDLEDGYEFFLRLGPMRNANERYLKNEIPFWNEMMKREARDDWWKARNIRAHLKNIKPAMMTVGGWFDAENLFGALEVYRAIETQSPSAFNILVMGPWVHGGWEARRRANRWETFTSMRKPGGSTVNGSKCRSSTTS